MTLRASTYAGKGCVVAASGSPHGRIARPVVAVLATLLAGCSMHPLPEDVSRASTYDIVERIRCEVKEALDAFKDDRHANRIIGLTAIGYDFSFDMGEGNHIRDVGDRTPGAALKFQRPSVADKTKAFSLDVTARAEKFRRNVRRFRIIEELKDVKEHPLDCSNATKRRNPVYPITGATGLGEIVSTYVRLEILTDFRNPWLKKPQPGQPPPIGTGVPDLPKPQVFAFENKNVVFSDVIKFTTRLTAGVKPTLTLSSIPGDLRMTSASIFGSAERTDLHTLIVAIATDPGTKERPQDPDARLVPRGAIARAEARAAVARDQRARLATSGAVHDSRTVTALVQKDAPARNRVLIELERLRALEDDEREAPTLLGERLLQIMREPANY